MFLIGQNDEKEKVVSALHGGVRGEWDKVKNAYDGKYRRCWKRKEMDCGVGWEVCVSGERVCVRIKNSPNKPPYFVISFNRVCQPSL